MMTSDITEVHRKIIAASVLDSWFSKRNLVQLQNYHFILNIFNPLTI